MKKTVTTCDRCKEDITGPYYHIEMNQYESPQIQHDLRYPMLTDGIVFGKAPDKQEDVCSKCIVDTVVGKHFNVTSSR